jgi:hypothetical protein
MQEIRWGQSSAQIYIRHYFCMRIALCVWVSSEGHINSELIGINGSSCQSDKNKICLLGVQFWHLWRSAGDAQQL